MTSRTDLDGPDARPDSPTARGPHLARLVTARREDDLDGEVLELLLRVMELVKDDFFAVAATEDLTPPQAFLLRLLDEPRPMRELADHLGYDASNITAIADKLEERGVLERRADPHDRRVKLLVRTRRGSALCDRLEARLQERMSAVAALDTDQKAQLRDLLHAAIDGTDPTVA